MKKVPKTDAFTFRRLLVKLLQFGSRPVQTRPAPPPPYASVIILAQEKLGDAILLTPLFRLLKTASPSTKIHVVTLGRNSDFYRADPHIDQVFSVKPAIVRTLKAIRRQRYDVLINTKDHPSFSYLLLTRIIKADYRLGMYHPYHNGFFNHLVTLDFNRHTVEKNCSFLSALSIPFELSQCRPQIPGGQRISSTILRFAPVFNSRKSPRIGINLSAGDADREWRHDHWTEFMKRFPGAVFTVFAMPSKHGEKRALEQAFIQCIPMPETATIYDAAEVIKTLDLLVTPDTSLIHLCSCLSIPVVALFRCQKVHISHFSPFMVPHRIVVSATMLVRDIPTDSVVAAASDLLGEITGRGNTHGT